MLELSKLEVDVLRAGLQELKTRYDQESQTGSPDFITVTVNDLIAATAEQLLVRLDQKGRAMDLSQDLADEFIRVINETTTKPSASSC